MITKRLIVCGMGNVGRAFLALVAQKGSEIKDRYGLDIQVGCIVDIGGVAVSVGKGLPIEELLEHVKAGGALEKFGGYGIPGLKGAEAIEAGEYDILIETTPTNLVDGEPAYGFIRTAIGRGMDIVSANKGPFVRYFHTLKDLAGKTGSQLFISAATGAALPTLDIGRFSTAGADITMIEGVLNGTTNFILTKMAVEGTSYGKALKEAQALGIAETDPTLDVEGYDTRNKLVLISNSLLGTGFSLEDVPVQGITGITPQDILNAEADGKVLKLVASASIDGETISLNVAPKALEKTHPLAAISYSEKGITYTTDTMGKITVLGGKSSPVGAAAALLKDVIHSRLFLN